MFCGKKWAGQGRQPCRLGTGKLEQFQQDLGSGVIPQGFGKNSRGITSETEVLKKQPGGQSAIRGQGRGICLV
jgi:hypothetical protein